MLEVPCGNSGPVNKRDCGNLGVRIENELALDPACHGWKGLRRGAVERQNPAGKLLRKNGGDLSGKSFPPPSRGQRERASNHFRFGNHGHVSAGAGLLIKPTQNSVGW